MTPLAKVRFKKRRREAWTSVGACQRKLAVEEFAGICAAHALAASAKTKMVLLDFCRFFAAGELFCCGLRGGAGFFFVCGNFFLQIFMLNCNNRLTFGFRGLDYVMLNCNII